MEGDDPNCVWGSYRHHESVAGCPSTSFQQTGSRRSGSVSGLLEAQEEGSKEMSRVISTAHIPWVVVIDGDDLVVRNIVATCFGGEFDAGDNGQTESGIMNDGSDPDLMGIALPIRSTERATKDSPLAFSGPHIPWMTPVMVWRDKDGEDSAVDCLLIDNGPNVMLFPTHALDLNPNVAALFAPNMPKSQLANKWSSMGFSYRIMGGAKFVS